HPQLTGQDLEHLETLTLRACLHAADLRALQQLRRLRKLSLVVPKLRACAREDFAGLAGLPLQSLTMRWAETYTPDWLAPLLGQFVRLTHLDVQLHGTLQLAAWRNLTQLSDLTLYVTNTGSNDIE